MMKTILLTISIIALVLSLLIGARVIRCKHSLLWAWLAMLIGAFTFVFVILTYP